MRIVYKPPGKTPYDIVLSLKERDPSLSHVPLAYAGRLDPLAEGALLILAGDECKHREQYQRLDKVYECTISLGIETDTYDPMGDITQMCSNHDILSDAMVRVENILDSYVGTYEQEYPPYSSVRVQGKPLYYWARRNKLHTITIPTCSVHIYECKVQKIWQEPYSLLAIQAIDRIRGVRGDFRQARIMRQWQEYAHKHQGLHIPMIFVRIACSSGTYMRSIAHKLGHILGTGAIAWHINRTHIGPHGLTDMVPSRL